MVVLHYTDMDSCSAALDRLCDPEAEVSAHYLISETGQILHLVEESQRAWHAGAGQWGQVRDVNSHSIGIELANTASHPFPEPQMSALEALLKAVLHRWSIRPERVIGHSDMAPSRKVDPGPRFDWHRLARQGLSIWPEPDTQAAAPEDFEALARQFGYGPDATREDVLSAFRLRFRPWAKGPLHPEDLRVLGNLARRFPVDQTLGSP